MIPGASSFATRPSIITPSHDLYGPPTIWDFLGRHPGILTALTIIVSILILEQTRYRAKKQNLPGPSWTIPIIGKFKDSLNPTLEGYQKQWDSGELSALSVFHIFIVIASSNQYTRKIMNSPSYTEPCLVHSAKEILERDNWVFLTGKVHADYRRVLNSLFTRKSLAIYLKIQDGLARKTYATWMADTSASHASIMTKVRDFNMETSLRVFCGPHIPASAVREIAAKYWQITKALELVNFPLALPGTKVYGAIQARKVAMRWLEDAARKSKIAMQEGRDVECLLDAWVMENMTVNDSNGKNKRNFSDHEMAQVVLSFLFASQDAMSSGIIYMFQHLADHPDILAKIREEQLRVRAGDINIPMSLEMLDEMPYLQACVKESLRTKPPVMMVPYKAHQAFPITADYTVPKNSMVIPSLYPSLMDPKIYPSPHEFNPDRWLDPENSANKNPGNYLVFGAGAHRCIGVEYTTMNMATALGVAAITMDWDHLRTPESDKVQVIATIFPKDGCLLKFTPRST
ncbi:hypothetical protein BS47DRAFT_1331527 [Hydnum rufescens UP504]|uniref:sterol 22-desaturase n=1 Tax=Hydnum rufescens UP504 TaxID=1448309 RepID=A0A9P6DR76_9AGAM|nr:hypothetical protein BS47DRAFT_1331527 [Hydnum rufescens UP504]